LHALGLGSMVFLKGILHFLVNKYKKKANLVLLYSAYGKENKIKKIHTNNVKTYQQFE
jgi:hypothetical protein